MYSVNSQEEQIDISDDDIPFLVIRLIQIYPNLSDNLLA